jgi:hypothetical protein
VRVQEQVDEQTGERGRIVADLVMAILLSQRGRVPSG